MQILNTVKESPKLTLSLVLTILTYVYDLLSANAEILGISAKTLTIVFLIINVVSFVWKQFIDKEESAFTKLLKHVGTRPQDPPKGGN